MSQQINPTFTNVPGLLMNFLELANKKGGVFTLDDCVELKKCQAHFESLASNPVTSETETFFQNFRNACVSSQSKGSFTITEACNVHALLNALAKLVNESVKAAEAAKQEAAGKPVLPTITEEPEEDPEPVLQ